MLNVRFLSTMNKTAQLPDPPHISDEESYDCFWGFYDALIALLGRKIDIVWYHGIKNPYFKEEVDETKKILYDQERQEVSL